MFLLLAGLLLAAAHSDQLAHQYANIEYYSQSLAFVVCQMTKQWQKLSDRHLIENPVSWIYRSFSAHDIDFIYLFSNSGALPRTNWAAPGPKVPLFLPPSEHHHKKEKHPILSCLSVLSLSAKEKPLSLRVKSLENRSLRSNGEDSLFSRA